jgi:hypothetical protein
VGEDAVEEAVRQLAKPVVSHGRYRSIGDQAVRPVISSYCKITLGLCPFHVRRRHHGAE